ncbi:MAG: GcvT family protein [Betaproteobacteria bacterium]|nr:GcvT family protein [Betaproteobacteria bacterium]
MSVPAFPTHARVVVIGGGVIGCSVAYHLGHLGVKEVVLLERARLTSGTTWHAAGLIVTFGSTSETSTEMRKYTRDLYARLEAETGKATGFRPVGFIEIATDLDRLEEYRRVAAFNRHCGVDVHEISGTQVGELFPLARTDDILAGFYVKEDGRADPVDITMALAAGARMQGVRIIEETPVIEVITKNGAVAGVRTAQGDIACEVVVNCAGAWSRQLGERNGVTIPLQAAEHYYLLTEAIAGVSKSWPVIEDPASYGYFREEGGGLMVGLFEPVCAPWNVGGIPEDFTFGEIAPDWERLGPYLETAMKRVPVTTRTGIKKLFCGPESFTPDLLPIFGEAPEIRNYFVAAGLNSIGILTGGGIGRALAHWIVHGSADIDITGMNIDRLHPYQSNPEYRRTRSVEALGMVYQCHYPGRQMQSARGAKRSPLHDRLVAERAHFKDVSGWEGADWYAPPGVEPAAPTQSWNWREQEWFSYWKAEHDAARNGVILMDMSFMAKFLVCGNDAGRLLNWISANHVDGDAGRVTYTQWLNDAGKIEADLTVTKLDADRFLVVASDTAHRHAETWMRRHIMHNGTTGAHVFVSDITAGMAQLNIQGPRSRELMQSLTAADMSNAALPFRCAREIAIGFARVLVLRITYLGELGYELYIPAEQATHVYERIVAAGRGVGLRHAGLKTLASCRMEKGYRDYGHDIDNTDSVLEAGLGFAVDLGKPGGFLGRDAVLAMKAQGTLTRRLVQILVKDPAAMMFHAEVVYRNGRQVGYIRAASYGHTLGGAVGLAMIAAGVPIDEEYLREATWEVDIAGRRYPAVASIKPLYDPGTIKVKG